MSDKASESEVDQEGILMEGSELDSDIETITIYQAFGCAKEEGLYEKTIEQPRDWTWPEAELTDYVGHVQIIPFVSMLDNAVRVELHGDDPNDAFIWVGGMDAEKVKEKYLKVRTATRRFIREVWD